MGKKESQCAEMINRSYCRISLKEVSNCGVGGTVSC